MTQIAIVYHSGYGHTKAIAEAIYTQLNAIPTVSATIISVAEADRHWDTLVRADAIVLGCPTYMGSVSAGMKAFMETSAKVWFTQGWKDKLAAGFTVSGAYSGDKLATMQQLAGFAAQHGMLWAPLGVMPGFNHSKGSSDETNRVGAYSGLMVQANIDQGVEGIAASDFETARLFADNIAQLAQRWSRR